MPAPVAVDTVRVAIIVRISTDEVNQPYSKEAQTVALEAFASSQPGWQITHRFSDEASGATLERAGLQRALRAAAAGEFDVLLVYRIDRLSRSIVGLMQIVADLEAAGVTLRSATEPIDTSGPVGRMLLQLLGIFAEFERSLLIDRITNGFGRKAARGEWLSGRAPFGYDLDKTTKTLVPNADAPLVPIIFGKAATEKLGARAIANWLNDTGRRTNTGSLWTGQAVLRVLRNPAYIGYIRHDDTHHPGKHDAILDTDVWERVQHQLDQRAADIDRAPASDYVLSGLTRCTNCGGAFIGVSATGKTRTYRYYACRTMQTKGTRACNAQRMPADQLEQGVIAELRKTYANVDLFLQTARDATAAHAAQHPDLHAQLANTEQRIRDTNNAIDRYLRAFENGTMPEHLCAPRLQELAAQRDDLTAHRDAITLEIEDHTPPQPPTREHLEAVAQGLNAALTSGPPGLVKQTLAALIDRVEIHPEREATPWIRVPATTRTPRQQAGASGPGSRARSSSNRTGVRMVTRNVEVMPQHKNSVVVAATRRSYRDVPKPGTFYSHVLAAVDQMAVHGHATVTPAQVAVVLELKGLMPKGNTVYRALHRLSDPDRFTVPPLSRVGRGKYATTGAI